MGGFAQHDSCSLMDGMADDNSVETAIFAALKRVNLIDDITKCRYCLLYTSPSPRDEQ